MRSVRLQWDCHSSFGGLLCAEVLGAPEICMMSRLLPPLLCCLLLCAAGCRLLPSLPPTNLSEPGWHVREGQAVWRMKRDAPEIAGEILLATKADGHAFVQFTKTPFPFLIGQTTSNRWQVELPT